MGPTTFVANRPPYFDDDGLAVLTYLAGLYHDGSCLVTTPARLLRYLDLRDHATVDLEGEDAVVRCPTATSVESFAGLTFTVSRPPVRVWWEDERGGRRPLVTETHVHAGLPAATTTVTWSSLPEFAW
jgi:hypothetical protein